MAKISARNAHELVKLAAISPQGHRVLIVLRSDGKVLRRLADGDLQSGYKVWATSKSKDPDALEDALNRRGYTNVIRK